MIKRPAARWRLRVLGSLGALVLALVTFRFCGRFHDEASFPAGRDPILEQLPIVRVVGVFEIGFLIVNASAIGCALLWERNRVPYFLLAMAIFVGIRAVFVALCPYGPLPTMLPAYTSGLPSVLRGNVFFDSEQFFSGHTSTPYMYFLFFRSRARWFFLASSAALALTALATRNHYTMDVLGAYFVTFSIYRLAHRLVGRIDSPPDVRPREKHARG
jgi:hypothetical protein